jgi:predicted extracellular nuclease
MIRRLSAVFAGLCLVALWSVCAQSRQQTFRVMFYNVENLFDTEDNPRVNDNEFLPDGLRRWTPARYYHHLQQTARVITAAGEWDMPALAGLCEVENDSVMLHLIRRTPLRGQGYRYCISQSPDPRGINVALLYQPDKFRYLGHVSSRIRFTNTRRRSRDVLHVWGKIITGDTLDVFVCHFPSRMGGEKETEEGRIDAARHVRRLCDSLCRVRHTPLLLVMGDFNDTPSNRSMRTLARSRPEWQLENLFAGKNRSEIAGSHKYRGEWAQLDQMLVSLKWRERLKENSARTFGASFLLTGDKSGRGRRPKRIYNGARYEGGFSDHLPVIADFILPIPPARKP